MNYETDTDELRPKYDFDFSKAVRGKYYQQYRQSSNIVALDPGVAGAFLIPGKKVLRELLKSEQGYLDSAPSNPG